MKMFSCCKVRRFRFVDDGYFFPIIKSCNSVFFKQLYLSSQPARSQIFCLVIMKIIFSFGQDLTQNVFVICSFFFFFFRELFVILCAALLFYALKWFAQYNYCEFPSHRDKYTEEQGVMRM